MSAVVIGSNGPVVEALLQCFPELRVSYIPPDCAVDSSRVDSSDQDLRPMSRDFAILEAPRCEQVGQSLLEATWASLRETGYLFVLGEFTAAGVQLFEEFKRSVNTESFPAKGGVNCLQKKLKSGLSVVVCVHDDAHRLRLCLEGFARQQDPEFDLHVCCDGGPQCIAEVVEGFSSRLNVAYHLRERSVDDGCAAATRNLGIRFARSSRVLFVDGDCVPQSQVTGDHKSFGDRNVVVSGARLHIAEDVSAALTPDGLDSVDQHAYRYDRPRFISSHLSVPTIPVKELGGFWEEFSGWGGEDKELLWRLFEYGCTGQRLKHVGVYHLDHPMQENIRAVENRTLKEASKTMDTLIRNGGPIQ
jgi:hypothetical protein